MWLCRHVLAVFRAVPRAGAARAKIWVFGFASVNLAYTWAISDLALATLFLREYSTFELGMKISVSKSQQELIKVIATTNN
jgi:hypothetical protein